MRISSQHHSRHSSSSSGHEKPKYSTYDWFPASYSTRSSLERPTRGHSRDSAYSRSDRDGSYDRLTSPPDPAPSFSHMNRAPKIPSYDRMVCAAVARLKNRKGSSIREIAKNVRDKYGTAHGLKASSQTKISSTAKRLVKEGKLVKDGNHFRLRKSRDRKQEGQPDGSEQQCRRHRHGRSSNRSPSPAAHRKHRRASSSTRGRSRSRSASVSRSRSRSRRGRRRRRRRRRRSRRRGRTRGRGASTLSRGRRRKKGGMRSQKRRLSYGRRYPHRRKYTRNKRRVKHSYHGRPKTKDLPAENSEKKGWFGSWFGRGNSGQSSNSSQGQGKGKGSGSSGANKSGNKSGNKDSGKQDMK